MLELQEGREKSNSHPILTKGKEWGHEKRSLTPEVTKKKNQKLVEINQNKIKIMLN